MFIHVTEFTIWKQTDRKTNSLTPYIANNFLFQSPISLIISSTQEKLLTHHHTSKEVDIKVVVQSILLLLIRKLPCGNKDKCYSTVTCKVLLNWLHSKLGQYCADSLPNLDKHITRRCESIALLLRNAPSFWTGRLSPTRSVSSPGSKDRDLPWISFIYHD